jgi:glycosyltransferase involved in cell wall biosynthesis
MHTICITKSGDIISEYNKLNSIWSENTIELIWDIKKISKEYNTIVVSQFGNKNTQLIEENIKLFCIKNLRNKYLSQLFYFYSLIRMMLKYKVKYYIPADLRIIYSLIIFKFLNIIIIPNISRENHVTKNHLFIYRILQVKKFIVPGVYYKDLLLKHIKGSVVLVRQPLYPEIFFYNGEISTFDKNKFNVLFASRLIKEKGIYEFVEAAIEICNDFYFNEINFHIVGIGEEYITIKKIIAENDLSNRIFLSGYVENYKIGNYLMNSDIFVFPSYTEGFAKSWIEAVITNTPMILTPLNAIKNILVDKKNCFYIQPRSSTEIQNAIIELYKNKMLLSEIRNNLKSVKNKILASKDGNFEECVLLQLK